MKITNSTSIIVSISLLTLSLSAGTHMVCKDGVCIIDISNLSPSKKVKKEKAEITLFNKKSISKKVVSLDSNEKIETIILPHEKYVMTKEEIENYELKQIQLALPNQNTENKILEKTMLPTSEYFCGKNKKPIYHKETDSFECA